MIDAGDVKESISRYSLVVLAAKRAKQIKEGAPILIDTESTNPLTIAMQEIAQGKVTILPSSITHVDPPPAYASATSPTHDPKLVEAQAGPLLYNGVSGDVGLEAEAAPGPASLEIDDPEAERLAEMSAADVSDENLS